MPIPTAADLAGHADLNDRVQRALETCIESQAVEFKESATWEDLKHKIVKTSLAMANLRDGGMIVVGVSERGNRWERTGISADCLNTFDPDAITAAIDRYASPSIHVDVVRVEHDQKEYLVFDVHEFESAPIVCRSDGPSNLRAGSIYVRPPGTARTEETKSAEHTRALLDLAIDKGVRKFVERAQRAGLQVVTTSRPFDDELEGL